MRPWLWLHIDEKILVGVGGICSGSMTFTPGPLVSAALAVPAAKRK